MTEHLLHGVIPILVTPFDEDGRIDEDSLARLVDYNVDAGVHGLGLALGSEIFKFNERERAQLIGAAVSAIDGRVPLVVNTGAEGTDLAVFHSLEAQNLGADALMVIPPIFRPLGPDEIVDYYRRIDEAVDLPIMMQDIPESPVVPALASRVADECDNVRYIKVERPPVTRAVGAMTAAMGDRLTVLGGAGGSYFIEEMRRGSRGTMPFPSQPGVFVDIWNRFEAGDEAGAKELFEARIIGINRLGQQTAGLPVNIHKQLLVRLGVIRTAVVRGPTAAVDATTQKEIDQLIDQLVAD